MANTFKLSRTKQCKHCPWKVSTNPHDIPDGYSEEMHRRLSSTIAQPGSFQATKAMACHHYYNGQEDYCIGWLENQIGPGNNIILRIKMMSCENISQIKTYGDQHLCFNDTLPENK